MKGAQPGAPRPDGPHTGPGLSSSPALPGRLPLKARLGQPGGSGRNSDLEQGGGGSGRGLRWTQGRPGLLILHRWSEVYFVLWWLVSSVIWVNLFLALILEVVDTPGPDSS